MNPAELIRAGSSLDFVFDRNGESITDWVATITVKQKPTDSATLFGVNRVVPPVGNEWPGFLTQSETSGFPASSEPYYLIATLVNSSTDEEEVIAEVSRFYVSTPWV